MKKIAILLLVSSLLGFGVACGGGGSDTKTDAAETQDYRGGDDEIYQADDDKDEESDVNAANEGDDQEDEEK